MKLEIRDYSSDDINDLWGWIPSSLEDVYFHLEIEIGEVGKKGTYLFELVVATPEGLRNFVQTTNQPFPDRDILVISEYDWQAVIKRLNAIVEHCSRDTWENSIRCLQRYFLWEYEDLKSHNNEEE